MVKKLAAEMMIHWRKVDDCLRTLELEETIQIRRNIRRNDPNYN